MNRRNLVKALSLGAVAAFAAGSGNPAAAAGRSRGSARQSNQVLDKMIAAINAHDVALLDQVYSADGYINHQALVMNPGDATKKMGLAEAKNYFAARFKAFPDITLATDMRVASRDLIAANLVWSGTQKDTYLGIPATNKHVTWNSTDILRVRDGKFVEHWGAIDFFGLVKQLQG